MIGRKRRLLRSTTAFWLLALAACGGGGGVNSTPAPTPMPAPTPTPTPAPTPPQTEPPVTTTPATPVTPAPPSTPSGFDTTEYRNSAGAVQANAITMYNAGYTGRGVVSAIVDGGIDTSNVEFAGRISAASADVGGSRGSIRDEGGHGTAVAAVLGAARNDSGPLGIAFDTTLLIARSDTPGSCATACKHLDSAIARGVDLATNNGARVINISLGGSPAEDVLAQAINRATAAGIVVVIAAGNNASADPDPLAQIANVDAQARNLVIIAGATNQAGDIASFSDRAGNGAGHYLMALGERVLSYDEKGGLFLYSGTSFSAPLISGAVALLAQAFPNLSGAQIVQLLYATATDLGATGVDATYGRGVLNLGRALQPQGGTALAGSAVPVSLSATGTLSAAMGDAAARTGSTVILDGYGRAYGYALDAGIRRPAPARRLTPALVGGLRSLNVTGASGTVAMSIAPGGSDAVAERLLLQPDQARRARALAGMAATRLGPDLAFAAGFAESGAALAGVLRDTPGNAFLVAGDPLASPGFEQRAGNSVALRRRIGRLGLTVTAETGDALVGAGTAGDPRRTRYDRQPYGTLALALDRRFGPVALVAGISHVRERDTVLGARFGPVFGGGGTTDFADANVILTPGAGLTLGAAMRQGWTRTAAGGASRGGRLRTGAWAFDIARQGVFGARDRLAFRFSQPLRVSSGGFALSLPVAYDYASRTATYADSRLDLAPTGREHDAEASFAAPLLGGWMTTNVYWRTDPGHYAALPDDVGGALRFSVGF